MNQRRYPILLLSGALLLAGSLPAQDPTEEIKQIVQRIDEQMRTIDQWLLESARKGETASKGHELLQKGQQQSEKVVEDIDELIKKLQQMKQRSQSQQSEQDQQQQDQQQQQNQRPRNQQNRNRQENPVPQQDQQQQDQQQQQQQQGQQQPQPQHPQNQPDGPEQNRDPGENRPGNRPPDNGTEKVQPGTGDGNWGDLQPYANFLKTKGSMPKVPEKFRKYYEGYLKDQAGKGK